MNSKTAKMLRGAAGLKSEKRAAQYEKPQLHHIGLMPAFETHKRTIRSMGPDGKIVTKEVEKIKYQVDGRTPFKRLLYWELNPKTGAHEEKQQSIPIPIAKPRRLKAGTTKRVYRVLKKIYGSGVRDMGAFLNTIDPNIAAEYKDMRLPV